VPRCAKDLQSEPFVGLSAAAEGAVIADTPLDRAAQHCIAAREAISQDGHPMLRLLADMLLLELARLAARRIGEEHARGVN
jgi:hypothetical protein